MNTRILIESCETNDVYKAIQLNLWGIGAWTFELCELSLKSVAISPKAKALERQIMTKPTHSKYFNYFSSEKALILCVTILFLYALFTAINSQSRCTGHVCLLDCLASQKCETTSTYKSRKWCSMFNWFVILRGIAQVYKCLFDVYI